MNPAPAETTATVPDHLLALRRTIFIGLSFFLTVGGFVLLLRGYSGQRIFWWDIVLMILFPLLFGQIAIGFVLALFGFYDGLRGGDPHHVMRGAWRRNEDKVPMAATAIVVPVFNEEVGRVTQGIANMWHSLEKTGQIEHFDFYLLSDSNDANHWIEEECAWMYLCRKLNGFGKIFYRKRRHAINGKSGNVADFCRRWGKRYRYMIVLDADSIMSGPTMVRLVRAMEANPQIGILQTQPYMVLGRSLCRRVLQFAGRVYGGIFSQGCSMAQMSSGSYWGHNAIIRVAPFIEYCDLPLLPVPDPHRRHVLSHDTVEAALMRRAGYEVWIAYEEPGSFEEGPPTLTDMLKRDRRWCAGNLQHFWFLFARGIEMGSRLQIWIGLMSYLCSPLWLAFLVATSFSAYARVRFLTFSAGPEDLGAAAHSPGGHWLFILTMVLLFTPRLLGLATMLPKARLYGGAFRLGVTALLENLLSILVAPVLMMFHTGFVLMALLGISIKWKTQNRAESSLSWRHCLATYGWLTVLGLIGQGIAFFYLRSSNYDFSYWLSPIFAGWILAPFLAKLTSSSRLGLLFRRWGLFITPEEVEPVEELRGLEDTESGAPAPAPLWTQALLCPYIQAIHLSMVRQRGAAPADAPSVSQSNLRERLLSEGPGALRVKEQLRLLWDAESVFWLHQELWTRPADRLHDSWTRLQADSSRNRLLTGYLMGA